MITQHCVLTCHHVRARGTVWCLSTACRPVTLYLTQYYNVTLTLCADLPLHEYPTLHGHLALCADVPLRFDLTLQVHPALCADLPLSTVSALVMTL